MIYLALEVPQAYLKEFEKYQDFNYAITPWFNRKDCSPYFNYMAQHKKPLWLDNGVNEYGDPLGTAALIRYAGRLKAQVIVPPDHPDDPKDHIDALIVVSRRKYRTVGCLLDSYRDRWNEIASLSDIVAIPYDLEGVRNVLPFPYPKPIHLFGFRSLFELEQLQGRVTSIDTGIPIKLAVYGDKIESLGSIYPRHLWKTGSSYITLKLAEEQRELAHRNCMVLRSVCNGLSIEEGVREADKRSLPTS